MSGVPVRSPLRATVRGRVKRAVMAAYEACGGKSGVAATCERGESTVGDWHNKSNEVFPPLDCAFAMDEAMLASGGRAEILMRYAAELGFAAIQLPESGAGADAEAAAMMDAVKEFGDVAEAIRAMVADGVREQHERDRCACEIDQMIGILVGLRSIVLGGAEFRPTASLHEGGAVPLRGDRQAG